MIVTNSPGKPKQIDPERILAQIGHCRFCQRDFQSRQNRGQKTCDGCGAPLPKIKMADFLELTRDYIPSLGDIRGGRRWTLWGCPIFGVQI